MDSVRVDICYRPLRIGWLIQAGDFDAFRSAVRQSFALWGGRFNPIIVADQEELAEHLIDLFRLDMIVPVGDSPAIKSLLDRFKYLTNPLFPKEIFVGHGPNHVRSQVLDIYNGIVHWRSQPGWDEFKKKSTRLYTWAANDPLADIFLMHFGQYPEASEIHIDYRALLKTVTDAGEFEIASQTGLTSNLFQFPCVSSLSRIGLERHYSVSAGWDTPGFFSGDASNLDDLICYWNLRAADIPLLFVDPAFLERYGETIDYWDNEMRAMVANRPEFKRHVGVWVREESLNGRDRAECFEAILKPFGKKHFALHTVSVGSLNGLNIRPPMMYLDEVSTLGVLGTESGKQKISFALNDKPFSGDVSFHTQHLIASLSFIGGLYNDEQHVLIPPFIPELNDFYARAQYFRYNRLRSEPDRVAFVINATDKTAFIYALPVADLFEQIFDLAGFSSKLSSGGLIARQLVTQFGGVDGARAFKIPGVRRLLKTHGPTAAFIKKSALELIGGKDPDNPTASFDDYKHLYIEERPPNTELHPESVFTHLVEKRLFRIGAELKCPNCRMDSWIALDFLKQRVACELCGHEFDATRQLVKGIWHYRRSGVLGKEKNAQGAIPVVLTLQQLKINMAGIFTSGIYSLSLDLEPKAGTNLKTCEIDFVWLIPHRYPEKTAIIIGECKDRGGNAEDGENVGTINSVDIEHLRQVADSLPSKYFETFIALVKLCPFTEHEVALAETLNEQYRRRVIILTDRELEPYSIYERTAKIFPQIDQFSSSPQGLADATAEIYFKKDK